MKPYTLSIGEVQLLLEALAYRASRLESMARFTLRTAASYERRAAAMRDLRAKLSRAPAGEIAGFLSR